MPWQFCQKPGVFKLNTFIIVFIDNITIPHHCMNVLLQTETQTCKYNTPKTLDFRVKYKTERCRYWEQQGYCPFGQMCAFVHDNLQMRFKGTIHQHYKTKPCMNYSKYGYCKYGDRCLFLHAIRENDRQRTRSNSPNEFTTIPKTSNRHQQNLKLLAEYGFGVFQAHMNRPHSKVMMSKCYEQCNLTSISTEPQNGNAFEIDENYIDDNFQINQNASSEYKKLRMYSI